MATDNVEFYERMHKLQAIQQQREQQRMSLEQEFNTYLKSDKRLNTVRASKLESYWTKICEDERRSRARNEQLLREYDRVEAHVAALSARTDRLRLLKDQYEKQVEMMYPRWQQQVEIKRRQQLLQQQREQQQLAQQLQQLQQQQLQQQLQGQQQPLQQQQQHEQHYLPQHRVHEQQQQQRQEEFIHQQQKEQMPLSMQQQQQQQQLQLPQQQNHSMQAVNSDSSYHHLRRASPLIPNIRVHMNTPPILTSEDPRYASVQFGTQPPNLSYRLPTSGQGYPTNLQGVRDTSSYEVPSGGSTLGLSQPTMPNRSLYESQQGSSSMPHVGAATRGLSIHAPPPDPDTGYTRLHTGIQSASHPSGSSMYSEIRHGEIAGSKPQFETTPQPHSQVILSNSEAPSAQRDTAVSQQHKDINMDIPMASNSHYRQLTTETQAGRVLRGSAATQVKPAPQAVRQTDDQAQNDDNDSVVTPLNDEDPYLVPEPVRSASEKAQLKSSEALKPSERAGSSVSAKAVSTARTDPFTSEDEDEEEDSTEKEALRDALQRQLRLADDAASEKRQTGIVSDKGQSGTKQVQLEKGLNEEREENLADEGPQQIPGVQQAREIPEPKRQEDEDDEEESESDDEIGSDMSLPLSDTGETEGPGPGMNEHKPADREKTHQHVRSQPKFAMVTVTEQGFWQLVSAVEQEIEQSDNIEKIYNLPECTSAIKTKIVKTANNNSSLDHLNPNAISMVVLEQLQQLVRILPGSCLLSDKLLDTKRTITEVTIRSFLYSSALGFWDKLLQHLVLLIRKGVMDAEDVASMVAPLLISPVSALADKAVDVLTAVLQDLEQHEDSQLDDTYSSLPSASATPSRLSMPHQGETGTRHQAPPEVPPLNLGETVNQETPELETDRVSHDSFFDEPSVHLTETKAYQQMMQSSQGHAKPTSHDGKGDGDDDEDRDELSSDGDEEDDEIERATRLSPETPPSSRNKKRRNVLSSLGGSGSLGISYGNDDEDAGGGAGGDRGETKRSEQMTDLVSSPSPSPSPKGSGYVPSAMEQSLKSTGRSDPTQRSAAFWGEESDMEESEMSVPMGTGTLKSDDFKDDFDFYD